MDRKIPAESEPNTRQLRILLAEDNLVNQEVGKLILESLNCQVDVVDDGAVAVETVFSNSYDLVFMDCQMPEVDGYEAAKMIRQREALAGEGAHHIPIVALTAHALEGDRELCLAGRNGRLPFETLQFNPDCPPSSTDGRSRTSSRMSADEEYFAQEK